MTKTKRKGSRPSRLDSTNPAVRVLEAKYASSQGRKAVGCLLSRQKGTLLLQPKQHNRCTSLHKLGHSMPELETSLRWGGVSSSEAYVRGSQQQKVSFLQHQKGKKSPLFLPTFLSCSPIATHDTSHNPRASQGPNATFAAFTGV